ncbi:DUF309 domain-containing protein [Acidobacteria bacterium AB60]|nr:DUF309 domain-containing protein [Acidobacteria bacterium AB60]
MAMDWSDGALAEGLRCYRNEEFFEAHEHWEATWLACAEPEKTFLQALIQVSAAFHHLRRQNRIGAVSLLSRALRKLEHYPEAYGGIEVAQLRGSIVAWLDALRDGRGETALPFPVIR